MITAIECACMHSRFTEDEIRENYVWVISALNEFASRSVLEYASQPKPVEEGEGEGGMEELMIYRFQADHIEDTLRIIANILGSRTKETCADRQVVKAIEFINKVLTKNIQDEK